MFVNKDDTVARVPGRLDNREVRAHRAELREYKLAIGHDEQTLAAALTALLGAPSEVRMCVWGEAWATCVIQSGHRL
ncbi:MAG: hypothetical protein RIQ71_1771 [Verrucomicrobiota bacterium]